MAYKSITFQAYYCDPSTGENLQSCGQVTLYFAGITTTTSSGYGTDETIKTRLSGAVPDLSALGGPVFCVDNLAENFIPRIHNFLSNASFFTSINSTGQSARLKLVGSSGSYAISTPTIANGKRTFGSSYQSVIYSLYESDGTYISASLSLTAYGDAACSFSYITGYTGGDVSLIDNRLTIGYYNINYLNNTNIYLETGSSTYYTSTAQKVADWLNANSGTSITYNLTNCTGSSDNPTTINPGDEEEVVFTADPGYSFQDQIGEYSVTGGYIVGTVLVTETTLSFTVALSTGSTGITISVNPTQNPNVEYRLVNCVKTTGPTNVDPDEYFDILLTASTGYQFNSLADVVVTSASLYEYRGSAFPSSAFYARYKANASFTKIIIAANLGGDPYSLLDGEIPGGDSISPTTTPTTTAVTSGIVALFKPTIQEMQDLADFMWTDFGGTATTTDDILKEIFQAIKRTISNPLDYIFGLNIIPSQGLSTSGYKTVRFGYVSSGVDMLRLSSQFFDVDCGSLSFDTVCGNTFLDYAPYAKFSIYLPYVGFREVDSNDFVGHTIGVKYKCDAVSGACVAYITKDGSVMYQYSGNVACTIPLSADSWGQTVAAAAKVEGAIISGAIAGAALPSVGATMGAIGAAGIAAASSVASNPSILNPSVNRAGNVTGAAGLLGVQYPFVVRESVVFHSTEGFNTIVGYPSWYYRRLGDLVGFTKVVDVHLHYINALRDEVDEIELLLKGGVIL